MEDFIVFVVRFLIIAPRRVQAPAYGFKQPACDARKRKALPLGLHPIRSTFDKQRGILHHKTSILEETARCTTEIKIMSKIKSMKAPALVVHPADSSVNCEPGAEGKADHIESS